jgi:C4-dicarboxylate-binding protein DctP
MSVSTKNFLRGFSFFALLLASVALSHAAEPIVIKFSHVVAAESPKGKAALRFKETVERRTGGRVKVEVYPNATLFKDEQELTALREGKVDMLAPALGDFSELEIPAFDVFGLPYVFLGRDMVRRVTDGTVGHDIFKQLEPKGIVGLAYWDAGFKIFAANKSVKRPQDIRGLRMRMSSKIYEPMFLALGATPIEMGFGATVKALQEGKVDGNENTPSNLYTRKMHELQSHMTVTNHVYLGYALIANKKFWDGLPGDLRVQVKLAVIDATRYANLFAERQNDDALTAIRNSGKTVVYTPSIDELNAWRKALVSTHRQFETRPGGRELLQAIYREGAALGYRY